MPGETSGMFPGSEEYKQRQAEADLFLSVGRERLVELAQAERDGRLVVLPQGVTRAALEDELHTMELQDEFDAVETYTTGYRNGRKNGRMELLRRILGVPDGTRQEAEAAERGV